MYNPQKMQKNIQKLQYKLQYKLKENAIKYTEP